MGQTVSSLSEKNFSYVKVPQNVAPVGDRIVSEVIKLKQSH